MDKYICLVDCDLGDKKVFKGETYLCKLIKNKLHILSNYNGHSFLHELALKKVPPIVSNQYIKMYVPFDLFPEGTFVDFAGYRDIKLEKLLDE